MSMTKEERTKELTEFLGQHSTDVLLKVADSNNTYHYKHINTKIKEWLEKGTIDGLRMTYNDPGWTTVQFLKRLLLESISLNIKEIFDALTSPCDPKRFLNSEDQEDILRIAIFKNQAEYVSLLLKCGFDPNGRSDDKNQASGNSHLRYALAKASDKINIKIIELLLEAGADPTRKFISGRIIIDVLRAMNNDKINQLLPSTPVATPEKTQKSLEENAAILGEILLLSSDITIKNESDEIIISCEDKSASLTRDMLNQKLRTGDTLLNDIADFMSRKVFFGPDKENKTVLLMKKIYQIASVLLVNQADPNIPNMKLDTPLLKAVSLYNIDLVRLLLQYNANPDIKNEHDISAKMAAELTHQKDILALFNTKTLPVEPSVESQNTNVKQREPSAEEKDNSQQPEDVDQSDEDLTAKNNIATINDFLQDKTSDEIIKHMKWKAHPSIRISNIDNFKNADSKIKHLNFGNLTSNSDVQRTLFNLVVYCSMLPKGEKKTELENFLETLSESPNKAEENTQKALKENEALVKNTGTGAFRLFHSLPHNVFNEEKKNVFGKPRLARSTTEELLIDFYNSVKAAGKTNKKAAVNSSEEASGPSRQL